MLENRHVQRTRVARSVKIIIGGDALMVDCTMMDLTSRGASLEFAGSCAVPDSFEMTLDGGRTLRACRVIWRRNERLGVAFEHRRE